MLNSPELLAHNQLVWHCFWDLRRGLESTTPIRWLDVQRWCEVNTLHPEQTLGVHDGIVHMDDVFVNKNAAKKSLRDQQDQERRAKEDVDRGKRNK